MKRKIIATIGPGSFNQETLLSLKERDVYAIRLNMSHTPEDLIETQLKEMLQSGNQVAVDTEGKQVRTGNLGKKIQKFTDGTKVRIYDYEVKATTKQLYLRPQEAVHFLQEGDLISVDFNAVLFKVVDTSKRASKHYVNAIVLNGGIVGNNKAVTIDSIGSLPAFSQKDRAAVSIAKKLGISLFTLSFIDNAAEVQEFRNWYPSATLIAKIETKKGVENFSEILKVADGILIDRGDLSREVPQERIPFAQKMIIQACNKAKKPVFVATNVLESMTDSLKPMKSEINDVINTLLDGVNGLVLTKETAVGMYPIQTVNTLQGLIRHYESLEEKKLFETKFSAPSLSKISYITHPSLLSGLVEPHGGNLVNGFVPKPHDKELENLPSIELDEELAMDTELIAEGVYSPLDGFMTNDELQSVLDTMRLPSGIVWTMPIIFPISSSEAKKLSKADRCKLLDPKTKAVVATMNISEVYQLDKAELCQKWFGTTDRKHPGVNRVMSLGSHCVGGKVAVHARRNSKYRDYELTPSQTRKIFQEKGWSVVVGFHTRNPIHRSHEFIQLEALNRVKADGLFVHPVIGKKKAGDFTADIIIKAYELMMRQFYPAGKVVMGVYPTYSRYAGPREAIFTALCRKNYGCSHFVVGRDHTGVGDFYHPLASQQIFNKFPDLGVVPVCFDAVAYSTVQESHVAMPHQASNTDEFVQISGTQIREMFRKGETPPDWFMRPEIAAMILKHQQSGKAVFV